MKTIVKFTRQEVEDTLREKFALRKEDIIEYEPQPNSSIKDNFEQILRSAIREKEKDSKGIAGFPVGNSISDPIRHNDIDKRASEYWHATVLL